jgi:hypothetical protein
MDGVEGNNLADNSMPISRIPNYHRERISSKPCGRPTYTPSSRFAFRFLAMTSALNDNDATRKQKRQEVLMNPLSSNEPHLRVASS